MTIKVEKLVDNASNLLEFFLTKMFDNSGLVNSID